MTDLASLLKESTKHTFSSDIYHTLSSMNYTQCLEEPNTFDGDRPEVKKKL